MSYIKTLSAVNNLLVILLILSSSALKAEEVTVAVIGDFGDIGTPLTEVSNLIHSWSPNAVITLGDNDYENDYTVSVTPYFNNFISSNCTQNKFYPTYGNHDWKGRNGYDEVFPCASDYYQFTLGSAEFFTINSDELTNTQISWLEESIKTSNATWKIVFLHHSPFSSGRHGSNRETQLDYADWGVDLVLSGHDHSYERITKDGVLYLVNGLGGRAPYDFENCCISGSEFRYNEDNGALRLDIDNNEMRIRFINRENTTVDDVTMHKDNTSPPTENSELLNNQTITLSGSSNESLLYSFELPKNADNLSVAISGGTGDADLYVNYEQAPSDSNYLCRPWNGGSNETCSAFTEQSGTWYIMVKGYTDFSNVQLSLNWDD
jgi:predicted phosphodiesterase